jgi:O-antigen/teichoic acid export membrane protein
MHLSIKRNLAANYASQIYVMGIGVIMAPVYLSYLGREAYGLIGFFYVMSAWFQLLDIGMTPTLAREAARFRGGAISTNDLRSLLRALEILFGTISILGGLAIILLSNEIAAHWLKVQHLSIAEVINAIVLMGLTIPLRWIAGLYRSLVNGFERQVWLGGYNIAIATLRFVGVLGVFFLFGATAKNFFAYQLLLAAIEACGLAIMSYRLIRRPKTDRKQFSWIPFRANLSFSLTIAFTAAVWLVLLQTDRMILSKTLTLSAFGVFSIAIVAAATISALNGALGQAVMPRLSKFAAEKNIAEMTRLYHNATQIACVIAGPAVAILTFFATPVLMAWTGKPDVAHEAAPILCLYAIGNGCASLNAFAYYLQYAHGNLRLHLASNLIQIILFVPLIFFAATRYGPIGTGAVWALSNGLYLMVYMPIVHKRFLPGNHFKWFFQDIAQVAIPVMMSAWILSETIPSASHRWSQFAEIFAIGIFLLTVAAACSPVTRSRISSIAGFKMYATEKWKH